MVVEKGAAGMASVARRRRLKMASNDLALVEEPWPGESGGSVDPYLRLAIALIESEGSARSVLRARSCQPGHKSKELPVLAELAAKNGKLYVPDELNVPKAYVTAGVRNVSGTIRPGKKDLRSEVNRIRKLVNRLKLAAPNQPHLEAALLDTGISSVKLPAPAKKPITTIGDAEPAHMLAHGSRVIIGIIDDGFDFAKLNFLKRSARYPATLESRVLCLWDQSGGAKKPKLWSEPPEFEYGLELTKESIDPVIRRHSRDDRIDEDEIYGELGYDVGSVSSHGTHVMDIAAGTDPLQYGVAEPADLVLVQLPSAAIGNSADTVLARHILDGVMYIFARAKDRPVVVNISYGGYAGPHDGTSILERGIDELLEQEPNRAVVVSAGNTFNEYCHASGQLKPGKSKQLRWVVKPLDPTLNLLEIWYDPKSKLKIELKPPGRESFFKAVPLGSGFRIQARDDKSVGWIFHRKSDSGNLDNHALIALRPTDEELSLDGVAPAPPGVWEIKVTNVGKAAGGFHAWIERDDAGGPSGARRRQARFLEDDADPTYTLASLATGKHSICVGAYNTATQEVCGYSACGPTRATGAQGSRLKPEICAPAEEEPTGSGVLCAASLSGHPTRMRGTSASAPLVTRLVALMFEAAQGAKLTAEEIKHILVAAAKESTSLRRNSREQIKGLHKPRASLQSNRVGAGKINAPKTIELLRKHLKYREAGKVKTAPDPALKKAPFPVSAPAKAKSSRAGSRKK
jgi:subtilisin family serine protease